MNRLLVFALLLGTAPWAHAQTQARFKIPAEAASWTIACEIRGARNPQGDAAAGQATEEPAGQPAEEAPKKGTPTLRKVEVQQTKEVRKTVIHWSGGEKREMWSFPSSDVIVTEDPRGQAFVSINTIVDGDPFGTGSLDWINTATPASAEPVAFQGVQCYHYKGFVTEAVDPLGTATRQVPCQAWIDSTTLLPVVIVRGNLIGKFTFGAGPASLVMPEKFKFRLNYYRASIGLPVEQ